MVPYIYTKFIYVLSHFCDGDLYISETEKKHDILLFVVCLLETNQIFSRIHNLTIQTRTTTLQNKYSYRNAVKRSINTSSTP